MLASYSYMKLPSILAKLSLLAIVAGFFTSCADPYYSGTGSSSNSNVLPAVVGAAAVGGLIYAIHDNNRSYCPCGCGYRGQCSTYKNRHNRYYKRPSYSTNHYGNSYHKSHSSYRPSYNNHSYKRPVHSSHKPSHNSHNSNRPVHSSHKPSHNSNNSNRSNNSNYNRSSHGSSRSSGNNYVSNKPSPPTRPTFAGSKSSSGNNYVSNKPSRPTRPTFAGGKDSSLDKKN